MQPQAQTGSDVLMHLVYDQQTGQIVSTYTYYDADSGGYPEIPAEQVLDLAGGGGLGVLAVRGEALNVAATHRVDIESGRLVPLYQLVVRPDRAQLNGDGADATDIQVRVTDEAGNAVGNFDGDLRAVTSRGKLSAPGGRITAAGGAASFRLTAAAETVARVRVTVSDPSGRCTAGSADLEFL